MGLQEGVEQLLVVCLRFFLGWLCTGLDEAYAESKLAGMKNLVLLCGILEELSYMP
jgi:hypothetical protein